METKSNQSANASAGQLKSSVSLSVTDKIASTPNMDNVLNAGVPVQSIDILKETKEKADITKPSDDMVAKAPNMKPSGIAALGSLINQKQNVLTSEEQKEMSLPNPTIVAQSLDSVQADKLASVQSNIPQQTIQSSAAQFMAELTVKDNVSNAADGKTNEAPQELSFNRNTSSNNNASTFDGFAGKMNKLRDQMSNIFPAGIMGCRENTPADLIDQMERNEANLNNRRFMDAKEASLDCVGHIDSTPRKRPNTSKPNAARNPLTGLGLDNEEDNRRGFGRRKDGNPVLGVGYGTDGNEETKKPSGRVPPGGHSTKLW